MNKRQLLAALKEIIDGIDSWDEAAYEKQKNEMTFHKFIPLNAEWLEVTKYEIKIKVSKKSQV